MTAVIEIAAPPEVPPAASGNLAALLLPAVMAVVMLGVTGVALCTGAPVARNPTFLAFPAMMSVSLIVTALTGRGRRRGAVVNADRDRYFEYLLTLRREVTEIAVAQSISLMRAHPDPETLWTLVGGPRRWERRPDDPAFGVVRVGVGTLPLATALVAAQTPAAQRSDPVALAAQRRFQATHATIAGPVVIRLDSTVTVDGEVTRVRGLLRAMVCQLAVSHPPDQLVIAGVVGDRARSHWQWLKWLPHNRHPTATDRIGPTRMVYPTIGEAQAALSAIPVRAVVIVDTAESADAVLSGATILEVGADGPSLRVRHSGGIEVLTAPDWLDEADALACARRLAAYAGESAPRGESAWASLLGIGEVTDFEPNTLWRNKTHRLCVPIGSTVDGRPLNLDIKEAAEQGMGPHGLCVGSTGSGKSELLRTVALGMMARNSPEVLNLLLIDFKGGATFLDFARSPHVAAVVTNLADEAPLVARMRDALAGEINRRQQLLRAAGCVSIGSYNQRRGSGSPSLPALFTIVDEFSELLSQHPDFADTFVAIGRLGRSLGMHLLLASQRLDEGRLRGLEAHLSYRICLKTLSASESRIVLGTTDAYELPAEPGAGLLRIASGEPVRFQAACVSGSLRAQRVGTSVSNGVRRFTIAADGMVGQVEESPGASVMHTVLDRLSGCGPPAHQVWLPPLEAPPTLGSLLSDHQPKLLTVPIGVVDRPYDQCRTPLMVDLSGAQGNVAVVGAPQSGKSNALCALITALAATHDPSRVQFYCLDFGGGALASVRDLAHVGEVADRGRPELVWRMIAELESLVRDREIRLREHAREDLPDVFLVVDGWAILRQEFEATEERITGIAAQGLSFGVHVMLSASRWAELRPALKDQIGTRIELRLGDPADSELDRKQARHVPGDRPGRGLAADGSQMMIAVPALDGLEVPRGASVAPRIPVLPTRVDYGTIVAGEHDGIVLGLGERGLRPLTVEFDECPRHLLILGDNGCGKTAALRTLCREVVRTNTETQARLFIVDFRRSLLGVVAPEYLGGYAMSPASLDAVLPILLGLLRDRMPGAHVGLAQLRARSWWTGPDIYVVVDDYDLVCGASSGNPLLGLIEYLPYATDLGLHVIVARRSGGASRALFEPLLADLRDLGCMAMLMSGRPDDGPLLGASPPAPLPPGRGVLITRPGDEQLVQVAWDPPA